MKSWKNYFKKQEERKPREQLVRAISFCKNKVYALDLGSGNFIESKYLAKEFQIVTAIDSSSDVKKYTKNLSKKISFLNIPFSECNFSEKELNLINAQFALPFYGKKGFKKFIERLIKSLKKDGIFVGQFFGVQDSFNIKKYKNKMVFNSKKEVLEMLSDFKILEFIEEEKEGQITSGELRHWHVFHFIAKRN
jgi:tellurite methyltransferase